MKNFVLFALLAAGFLASCKQSPEGQQVQAETAQETAANTSANAFQIDPQSSSINWTASKVGGQHNGTLAISGGNINLQDGAIQGGTINLDMNAIAVLDLEGEQRAKLENHLRTGDFFEADKHPAGAFEIVSVAPVAGNPEVTHQITGNLTLKGVSKSVTIPANVVIAGDMISAITPSFTINRTEWGINYRSGILGTAKDKIIADEIGLVINLRAKKA